MNPERVRSHLFSLFRTLLCAGMALIDSFREMEDAQLVERARAQGEEGKQAFRVLLERHEGMLLRVLTNLVRNKADAEELLQNAMVRAFFALPSFRGEASFKSWARTIAMREAYNHHRRHGARREANAEFLEDTLADSQDSGQERLAQRDALRVALGKVPYPYREILVLRYVEELSLDEIGDSLELGSSATKMRLKRARAFFKDAYGVDAA